MERGKGNCLAGGAVSETMDKYWKAKAERLQSQVDRIGKAYCHAPTDEEFAEIVYQILQEGAPE